MRWQFAVVDHAVFYYQHNTGAAQDERHRLDHIKV
jgi:hypothetical protein